MGDGELVPLLGGNMGDVGRQGDTVVRPAGEWSPSVHRLLCLLNDAGVGGIPRPLSLTDQAEVLTFIQGTVPSYPMPDWVWSDTALASSAQLLRQVHDATADADVAGPWRSPVREPVEVICHNDFATYNLVFNGPHVIGAIDWDYASPGPRLWDLAYLAYRIVPLSRADRSDGFTDDERHLRLKRLIDTYGSEAQPAAVIAMLRDRLLALADFSEGAAHSPRPA